MLRVTIQRASDLYASNLKTVLRNKCLSGTLIGLGRVRTSLHLLGLPLVNAPASRPLGAYNLEVATPRALVYAGLMTSRDGRSWYMISEDAKSWVLSVFEYIHCHVA
ncbi:hypothetical protein Tco_0501840 [Tanacetum coccineum]